MFGYVAQLEPPPETILNKETWSNNKVLHVPFGAFSPAMANGLGDFGLLGLRSITMTCGASLLRAALDGKLEHKRSGVT